ncbi:MAG: hypothetical protein J6S14_15755 [Clostridia bacterium]|nr:hypothetical protein [Clostridia bacterium]
MLAKLLQKFFNFRAMHCRRYKYYNADCGNYLPGIIDVLWERRWVKTHRGWTPTYIRLKG